MVALALNNLLLLYRKRCLQESQVFYVTIKFCQKQSFADILQNRSYQKFRKFHWQTPVLEPLSNKV